MNENPTKLAALILAAGYSSRMGRAKALLPFGGQTARARVIGSFRQAGIDRIGVVTGHNYSSGDDVRLTVYAPAGAGERSAR